MDGQGLGPKVRRAVEAKMRNTRAVPLVCKKVYVLSLVGLAAQSMQLTGKPITPDLPCAAKASKSIIPYSSLKVTAMGASMYVL